MVSKVSFVPLSTCGQGQLNVPRQLLPLRMDGLVTADCIARLQSSLCRYKMCSVVVQRI